MIQIENVEIYGWKAAILGMRNPLESWSKSDSQFDVTTYWDEERELIADEHSVVLGENDIKLMQKLIKAGSDHAKFLRMVNVTCDITAPRMWFLEFDTYKVGTVSNSCSTMHTIHKKPFELSDFSTDGGEEITHYLEDDVIPFLNFCRNRYLGTKNKGYWRAMILALPQSYNQKRTVQLNYEVLKRMYFARKNHKLDEWRNFCKWAETLPYFKDLMEVVSL